MYWEIGRLIVEEEQQGNEKAQYGKAVLKNLSAQLTLEFGKGFDDSNLRNIRQFYLAFPIRDAVRHELSWTHYRIISRVDNATHRLQYIAQAINSNWDTRTLQRNINTQYMGRALELPAENPTPQQFIRDPYIFEFLNLPTDPRPTENNIETALINHIRQFLMELGKGFAFVARQHSQTYHRGSCSRLGGRIIEFGGSFNLWIRAGKAERRYWTGCIRNRT